MTLTIPLPTLRMVRVRIPLLPAFSAKEWAYMCAIAVLGVTEVLSVPVAVVVGAAPLLDRAVRCASGKTPSPSAVSHGGGGPDGVMPQPEGILPMSTTPAVTTAYCMRCKARREIDNAQVIALKNGKPAVRGVCSTCGSTVMKIGAPGA